MLRSVLAVLVVVGTSCSRSHGRHKGVESADASVADAALDTPAESDVDAPHPATGHYWTIETTEAAALEHTAQCEYHGGVAAHVRLTVTLETPCERLGPTVVEVDERSRTAMLTPQVWVDHVESPGSGECAFAPRREQRVERVTRLREGGLSEGEWTVSAPGAESLEFTVWPARVGGRDCSFDLSEGAACSADCQCEVGLACVTMVGDATCGATCQRPCNIDLDCPEDHSCGTDLNYPTPICVVGDACGGDDDCDRGQSCPVTESPMECQWAEPFFGHCATDDDCHGFRCVEARNRRGPRSCEAICYTHSMRCPIGALCGDDLTGWYEVCGWIGD